MASTLISFSIPLSMILHVVYSFTELQGEGGYFTTARASFKPQCSYELMNFVIHSLSIHSFLVLQYNFDIMLGHDSLLEKTRPIA